MSLLIPPAGAALRDSEYEVHCVSVVSTKCHHDATQNGARSDDGNPNENRPGRSTPPALPRIHRRHSCYAGQSFEPGTDRQPAILWNEVATHRPLSRRTGDRGGGRGDPHTYYFGTPGGGVWKTTDGGRVWRPISDQERVASIGALTVAPSNSRGLRGHGRADATPGNFRSGERE